MTTGSGLFTSLCSGFAQIFSEIVSTSVKKPSNTNYIASRHIKGEKNHHFRLTCVRLSKMFLLKLAFNYNSLLKIRERKLGRV